MVTIDDNDKVENKRKMIRGVSDVKSLQKGYECPELPKSHFVHNCLHT
jgi:hypothetical protein